MKKYLTRKILILLLAVLIMTTTGICSGQNQVYARKSTKKSKPVQIQNVQYTVSQDGLGDFTSIQEAVNHAKSGDTLIIYPGIYTENVNILNKAIHIVGIDKDSCILKYNTFSYFKVPLEIAAGSVSNLTIYGFNSEISPEDLSLTEAELPDVDAQFIPEILEHQKNHTGYAVHIDQNFLYEKEVSFRNCKIISENNHCIGIGTRGKSNLSFEDCEIISNGNGGCIYLHDCLLPEYAGDVNFSMKNCNLICYKNPYAITIESLGLLNTTYLTFQNIKVSAVAYDEFDSYIPNNINTSFDIDTLLFLDKENQLETAGLTSTAMHHIVHELSLQESREYMKNFEEGTESKIVFTDSELLPEGITYIKSHKKDEHNLKLTSQPYLKKSIFNFVNGNGFIGNGWCGLNNVYVTPNSWGNTLIEMNSTNFNGLGYHENIAE